MAQNVMVIGTGYVGLVTGAVLADLGHSVTCVDIDKRKIDVLNRGDVPIYEPGLQDVILRNVEPVRRLTFTTDFADAIGGADVLFIAVGTPQGDDGDADLTHVEAVSRTIGANLRVGSPKTVVIKSTVPVGTNRRVTAWIREALTADVQFEVVSNPEFLREGAAIQDTLFPHRIVVGTESLTAFEVMRQLYAKIEAPILRCNPETAELIKYSSNAFLATKISFINEVANLCEKVGADVHLVAQGMGLDTRIGTAFLRAGVGFGGSCFPKDTQALLKTASKVGLRMEIVQAAVDVNEKQKVVAVEKLRRRLGSLSGMTIGLLGLAFKPHTDDMREAPALAIIEALLAEGATVRATDPIALLEARHRLEGVEGVILCRSAEEVARGVDGLVLVTEWEDFTVRLFPERLITLMRRPIFIDGRNALDSKRMMEIGFDYEGVGR
jgi:UDPglucose 6-dehydrogenase